MSRLKIPLALSYCLLAASAQAHPGHSLADHGLPHVVASPYHLAALALVGGLFLTPAFFVQRPLPRRVMQVVGAAALLAAALLWPAYG